MPTNFNDSLKNLGKCFYFSLDKSGFVQGPNPLDKTEVDTYERFSKYNPNAEIIIKKFIEGQTCRHPRLQSEGIDVLESFIKIGKDYAGSLKLPDGTEAIEIFETKAGEQVIHYCHRFKESKYGTSCFTPFANELRSADNRVNVEDIISEKQLTEFKIGKGLEAYYAEHSHDPR
jgi:hypothetical protein